MCDTLRILQMPVATQLPTLLDSEATRPGVYVSCIRVRVETLGFKYSALLSHQILSYDLQEL